MKIYTADCRGDKNNCIYANEHVVCSDITPEEFSKIVGRDYSGSQFKDNRRSNSNFLSSDCVILDVDNESDNPSDWVGPEAIIQSFPDVWHAIHFSRHHMQPKGFESARPRFHVFFPIDNETDAVKYAELKQRVLHYFPHFDANCKDAARFFFGTENAKVQIYNGSLNLTQFMKTMETKLTDEGLPLPSSASKIPQGRRNSELYTTAVKLQIRYGDCDESRKKFVEESKRCEPQLPRDELNAIWRNARKFANEVQKRPGYILPEQYNQPPKYLPEDFSHVAEADMLAQIYGENLRFTTATGFICYDNICWTPSETKPRLFAQELSEMQLQEAGRIFGGENYVAFAQSMRNSGNITAVLREVAPMLEIGPEMLDRNPYYLCTPSGTLDLSRGIESMRPNRSEDLITKVTSVSPSCLGSDLWESFLDKVFCSDSELIEYVQLLCGVSLVGKVTEETLIISFGNGKNGKSTFWNAVRAVLGTYSDGMAADILTKECKRNIYPELAELQGKRLIIASETAEGARLNEALLKQMCSSDFVRAERKYRDPFSFRPSHTVVLFTNFLPKIGSSDTGTWRRLKLVPFNAIIENDEDIKNYAEFLVDNAGEAILLWAIEGAKKLIDLNYKIVEPKVVAEAVEQYRQDNNWFHQFVSDCCEIGQGLSESSARLYASYRSWSESIGERSHSTSDFYKQLENGEFHRVTQKNQRIIHGIKLKNEFTISNP